MVKLSNDFYEYLKLNVDLIRLIEEDNDSEEADKIRDKMDIFWRDLTEEEIKINRVVSVTLNKEIINYKKSKEQYI